MSRRARRPRIGVTGPDRAGLGAWLMTALAVRRAGGSPRRITPSTRPPPALDGLIVGGGADVDPALYGALPEPLTPPPAEARRSLRRYLLAVVLLPAIYLLRRLLSAKEVTVDAARDRLETELIRRALDRRLPVLGICRGAQLLNVCFGGSLHRDLAGFYAETPQVRSIRPRKGVRIVPGSRLGEALGTDRCRVNALNHQAIDAVGEGLVVAAREGNGLIQAIEHERLPFVIGVQWHPEYLPHMPAQQALFRRLVAAARRADGPSAEPADALRPPRDG